MNNTITRFRLVTVRSILGLCLAATPLVIGTASERTFAQQDETMSLDDAVAATRVYEFGDSREALSVLANYVTDALHDAHLGRDELQTALLSIINDDDATVDGKRFACRQLARVGTPGAAESLETLLLDDATHDVALEALMHINDPRDPRTTMVLLGATDVLEGSQLVAVINALAARGNAPELLQLLQSINLGDSAARLAAMNGAIPADPAAVMDQLREFERDASSPRLREEARRVIVDCARAMVNQGMGDEADMALSAFDAVDTDPGLRYAVMLVRAQAAPDAYGLELLDRLEMANTFDRLDEIPTLVDVLSTIQNDEFLHTYSRHVHNRAPEIVAAMIEVARRQRGPLAEQMVLTHLARSTDNVTIAEPALRALGDVGTANSGPILVTVATTSPHDELRVAAKAALATLPDRDIDEWLAELVSNANASYRTVAVESLAARESVGQVRAILVQLREEADNAVAVAMCKAATPMVNANHVAMIIDAAEAREAIDNRLLAGEVATSLGDCLVAALTRADDVNAAMTPLLMKIQQAREGIPAAWLHAAATIGGDDAHAMFMKLLANPDRSAAALLALEHWPNTRILPDLMKAIESEPDNQGQSPFWTTTAAELLTRPGTHSGQQRLEWARTLLSIPNNDLVQIPVIRKLGRLGTQDSLAVIVTAMVSADPEHTSAAADALLDYATLYGATNSSDTLAALRRLKPRLHSDDTRISRVDEAIAAIDRARSYIHAWTWAGPYDGDGTPAAEQFDMAFPPEGRVAVQWSPMDPEAIDAPGVVNLARLIGGSNRTAYLRAEIQSDTARQVQLAMGSDDGLKVWLNGAVVHENMVMRGHSLGSDVVDVTLKEGTNILLLKVIQGGGDWKASCRIVEK